MKKVGKILLIIVGILALGLASYMAYLHFTKKTIAVLLYDDMTMLEAVGAYQTFSGLMLRNYQIKFVAKQKGMVRTSHLQSLQADSDFSDVTEADILFIPGGQNIKNVLNDRATLDWVQKIDAQSSYTTSTGSGALILGAVGLLKGKKAATHWICRQELEHYGAEYSPENYIRDGKYYTGLGASAAIDMILSLIRDIDGDWLSKATQLFIVYDPAPPVNSGFWVQADTAVIAIAQQLLRDSISNPAIPRKTIAILLYKGFTMLDVTGPYQVFSELEQAGYDLKFVAKEKGSIKSDFIQSLQADYSFADLDHADILFVPGGSTTFKILDDTATLNWIKKIDQTTTFTTSVCTGSILLGEAGLLKNHRATTHWYVGQFLNAYGATYTNDRYTKDAKYITGAGISAGIDLALFVSKELLGTPYATAIQLKIGYHPSPPFDAGSPEKSDAKTVEMMNKMYAGATKRK